MVGGRGGQNPGLMQVARLFHVPIRLVQFLSHALIFSAIDYNKVQDLIICVFFITLAFK